LHAPWRPENDHDAIGQQNLHGEPSIDAKAAPSLGDPRVVVEKKQIGYDEDDGRDGEGEGHVQAASAAEVSFSRYPQAGPAGAQYGICSKFRRADPAEAS